MIVFGKTTGEASSAPFLIEMTEREDNEMKLVVALPTRGEIDTDSTKIGNAQVDALLKTCAPIHADTDNRYEIIFENYVLHMTRNESYAWGYSDEIGKGDYFVLFEKSKLLEFLPQIVEAEIVKAYCPQGYQHYGIICQNHIVDVIAASEPKIRKL